jgi:hypothetical protein
MTSTTFADLIIQCWLLLLLVLLLLLLAPLLQLPLLQLFPILLLSLLALLPPIPLHKLLLPVRRAVLPSSAFSPYVLAALLIPLWPLR